MQRMQLLQLLAAYHVDGRRTAGCTSESGATGHRHERRNMGARV